MFNGVKSTPMQIAPVNIYPLLDNLKLRKAMCLGNDYTFQSLESFIHGFTIAASAEQLQLHPHPAFHYFSTWLLGHLKEHFGLTGGWHWQITNRNPGNDEKAFEEFFAFLDVFKNSIAHATSVRIDEEAREFYKTSGIRKYQVVDGKQTPSLEIPHHIIWTTIENSATVWLEYQDEEGMPIWSWDWYVNAREATAKLKAEFGSLKGAIPRS